MLLLRGATQHWHMRFPDTCFNTCSSCEEQLEKKKKTRIRESFNTCSSCEEQPGGSGGSGGTTTFQYMLLLRGATRTRRTVYKTPQVSIHAPLARSNFLWTLTSLLQAVSIHAPLARSNPMSREEFLPVVTFQYMLLLRGATELPELEEPEDKVSIHAPLARSNFCFRDTESFRTVSIHAPLARSNLPNS